MNTITKLASILALATFAVGCDSDDGEEEKPICNEAPGIACVFMGSGIAGLGEDGLPRRETELYLPQDVTIAPDGTAYIVDWNNHRIRGVDGDIATTLIGTGYLGDAPAGTADEISLNHPTHLTVTPAGTVLVSAWHNSKILSYDPARNWVEPICGTGMRSFAGDGGPAAMAILDLPVATALGSDGSIYIADQANQRVRRIDPEGVINTFVGTGTAGFAGDGGPALEAMISLPGGQAAPPAGRIAVDAADNLYIADSANHRVRRVGSDGMITTIVGDGTPRYSGDGGPASAATVARPSDVDVDLAGNVYIADTDNSCVRRIDPAGNIDTVVGICGSPGLGDEGVAPTEMAIDRPYGVTVDRDGNIYVADTHNHRIIVVYPE